jgi:spermidine synthase
LSIFTDIGTGYLYGFMAVCVLFASMQTKYLFIAVTIVFLTFAVNNKDNIHIARNFFGVIKIYDGNIAEKDNNDVRIFLHGTTLHGFQPLGENYRNKSFGYYGEASPVGDIFQIADPSRIAVIGLGVGLLGCHTKAGRDFTFYEIDQNVIDAAKTHFTALKDCGYKDIILGDGRLELAKTDDKYDVIFMDAFSSDSVPAHLITEEAIEIYFSKMKDDAPVVVHISNRHLDLRKPLAAIAKDKGYYFREKIYEKTDENPYEFSSHWTVITKDKNFAEKLDKKGWKSTKTSIRPWTDDYSNLLVTFKFLNIFKPKEKQVETEE